MYSSVATEYDLQPHREERTFNVDGLAGLKGCAREDRMLVYAGVDDDEIDGVVRGEIRGTTIGIDGSGKAKVRLGNLSCSSRGIQQCDNLVMDTALLREKIREVPIGGPGRHRCRGKTSDCHANRCHSCDTMIIIGTLEDGLTALKGRQQARILYLDTLPFQRFVCVYGLLIQLHYQSTTLTDAEILASMANSTDQDQQQNC